ncbi:MAG: STAS domain-containing protein [Roseiflexaceae bacterium]
MIHTPNEQLGLITQSDSSVPRDVVSHQRSTSTRQNQLYQTTLVIAAIAFLIGGLDLINTPNVLSGGADPVALLLLACGGAALFASRLVVRGLIWPAVLVICLSAWGLMLYAAVGVNEVFLPLLAILGIVFALPYVSSNQLRVLMIIAVLAGTAALLLAHDWSSGRSLVPVVQRSLLLGLILYALWGFHRQLSNSLATEYSSNQSLQAIRANLEDEVRSRTADLSVALELAETRATEQARLLEEIGRQREIIRGLSVPVLPVTSEVLVLPLVGDLDGTRLAVLMDEALAAIQRSSARHLVLDITGVPVVDTQVGQGLIQVTQAVQLLGAEVTLVGVRPEVAQTIVSLGLGITRMQTFSDLRAALGTILRKETARQR